ncbi:MAG TPA: UvrD-helicase domain-containing protein [Vicinamibacteria bacterium]|nr:UvrD-helicase domain-containing protein [Vicinamibacteria bacterium]
MKPDAFVDRRARTLATDPTLNIALEASAGTGKTSVLVRRYLRLVEEGASPRHILALTFTRKAAGEMKTRIVDELKERGDLWADIRQRLFEIHVTTIDAFCLGLLREFPLEAGLDPDLRLLDHVETERLMHEAIDDAFRVSRTKRAPDLSYLLARFGIDALRRGLRDFLVSRLVRAEILDRYAARVLPPALSLRGALERVSNSLGDALRGRDGVERFLQTGPSRPTPSFGAFAFALRRGIDSKQATPIDVEEILSYFLTQDLEPRRRPPLPAKSFSSRADYERHRDRVLGLAPLVAGISRRWTREKDFYAIRHLHLLYRTGAARFDELKQLHAGLDFTDILTKAVQLLEKRGEFAQSRFRLESRYHHLLIDEFQDTNEAQWRLVAALVSSWGEGAGLVQEVILDEQSRGRGEGRIREPSLFIVGDKKQSIYGWRDARVEVLEKASRHLLRIRTGAKRLTLRHSFRAQGKLLAFLNDLFSEMPKAPSDLDWSFQYREADHFPVSGVADQARPVALAVGTELTRVAGAVADEVVRLLEDEKLRPRDITVLFRNRSSYRAYEEALTERGVPTYVYRGLGFFDSPEVRDVTALVRFLAEPDKELRAAELARSRFVGISDTALVRLAIKHGSSGDRPLSRWLSDGILATSIPLVTGDRKLFERATRLVPRWLEWVDRIPPVDLLDQILDESEYAGRLAGREQSWENLKKLLEMIRRAENRGYLTMSRLADFLENATTDEESPAVLEAVDAVNLMTIHAAKGLEFESVFLVNLHQRARQDRSLPRIRELADGRVEVSALTATDENDAPNRVVEEEKRLLYVALTRARRFLSLSVVLSDDAERSGSLFALLPEEFQDCATEALVTTLPRFEWRGHEIRLLGSREPRRFEDDRPPPAYRLRLEPLSGGAYELRVETADGGDRDRDPAPSEGSVYRNLSYSMFRHGVLHRGVIPRVEVGETAVVVSGGEEAQQAAAELFPGREIVLRRGKV